MRHQTKVCTLSRWDNISTLIHAITAWLSLSPSSSTRIPVGLPYGSLSQWERYGLTTFYVSTMSGLGLAYPPVAQYLR